MFQAEPTIAPHHVVLIAIGSSGDVHPFIGLGLALQRRGHRVTVATNDYFAPLVARAGLGFASLGTLEEFQAALGNPEVWHPARGLKAIVDQGVGKLVGRVYEMMAAQLAADRAAGAQPSVAAGTLLALGARVAQEHLGLRYASVGFAPSVIRSVEAPPRLPYLPWLRHAPRAARAGLLWLLDTAVADPLMAPPVNALRTRMGLPPVRGIIRQWWYSPTLNLCLWPAVFGARQNDWPAHSVLTGFPLWDESSDAPLPPDVAQFLAQPGGAPIVFTPGSAMRFGHDFFEAAVGACQKLQRRGLLLTRYPEQLPSMLPGGVMHAAYAPFSQLLPHTAALVHHGGIGTTSQALGAGVPQLVMPMAHDQFDNADRVKRLGLGDWLPRHRFSAANVAARLQHLLGDAGVAAAAQRWSHQQSQAPDGCDAAARVLEALMAAPVCTRSASVV